MSDPDAAGSASSQGGRPPKITTDDVVDAALCIADAEGLGALSMRRLAGDLGVAVTTLYNHVSSKNDLLTLLRSRTLGALQLRPDSLRPWRDQLQGALTEVYVAFRDHPSGIDILYSQSALFEPGLRAILDNLVDMLCQAGFSAERAIDTLQTLQIYVAAMAGHERVQARRSLELGTLNAASQSVDAIAHARRWIRPAPQDTFETGLDGIIESLANEYT